jgi:hypothetical protein
MSRVVIGATLVSLFALTTAHAQNDIFNRAQAADQAKNYAAAVQLWGEVTHIKDPPPPPRMAPYNPQFAQALTNAENMRAIGYYELGVHSELGLGVPQNWQTASRYYNITMRISPAPHPNAYYAAVLREIIIMYHGLAGQQSKQIASNLTNYLRDQPKIQEEMQTLIEHDRVPRDYGQLSAAWEKWQKDSVKLKAEQEEKDAAQAQRDAEARQEAHQAWIAKPLAQRQAMCGRQCSGVYQQCHLDNTNRGLAAMGVMGFNKGMMMGGIMAHDCNQEEDDCKSSCLRGP